MYHGVSWHSGKGRWQAVIKAHGKLVHLGRYSRPEVAARVWDVAAVLLRGEGALKNFDGSPPEGVSVGEVRARLERAGLLRREDDRSM